MFKAQQETIINELKKYIDSEVKTCSVLCNGYSAKHFTQKQIKDTYINHIFGAVMFAQSHLEFDPKICDELYVDACERIKKI